MHFYESSENYFWSTISLATAQTKDVQCFATGAPSGFLNPAIQKSSLEEDTFQQATDTIQKFYHAHHLPWVWLIKDTLVSPTLVKKKSLIRLDQSTAMYCMINKISPLNPASQLSIKEVNRSLDDWAKILDQAYPPTSQYKDVVRHYTDAHKNIKGDKENFFHFVGYLGTLPVTCCTLSLHEKGARIDDVGTLPLHRKKGFATHIILHALRKAQNLNRTHGFLEASDGSTELYEKIGFRELFSLSYFQLPS